MKKYLYVSLLAAACLFASTLYSQCVKPTPMNQQQKQLVTGTWKGVYTSKGEQKEIQIDISMNSQNEVVCNISNPPMQGKETAVEYFFCPGGEFHLKKYINDVAYVFQGVPEDGHMRGVLSVYTDNNKRTQLGNFEIDKKGRPVASCSFAQ